MQQHKWISRIFIRSEYSSFSSDFKISSSCFSNHLQCNGNCVLRPDLWAISRTITKTMALQSSPKWSKAMKPAQKSDFSPVRLKQTHYVNIMLQLLPLSFATRASALAIDKSRLMHFITCDWQLYPQGSQIATLIGLRAATRFWVAKTGANQVWKVLRPAPH